MNNPLKKPKLLKHKIELEEMSLFLWGSTSVGGLQGPLDAVQGQPGDAPAPAKKLTNDTQHPVVNVSWDDAKGFCDWLGTKDGKIYRLPTDHEWSCAVGIGDQENAKASPKDKNGKVAGFPWSGGYPPPKDDMGNYYDTSGIEKGLWTSTGLKGYNDGYPLTAPVMSFPANKLGIYDLGGNVWEWCQDLYKPDEQYRVLRGASWYACGRDYLASSCRFLNSPDYRDYSFGFRVVVVVSGSGGSAP